MSEFLAEEKFLREMFDAAVAAAMPSEIVPGNLPLPPKGRTVIVGAGKASAAMAQALERHWNGPVSGLVITRYGHAVACENIEIVEASHPVPDQTGQEAAKRILELAGGLGPDDLMIALISGGGSSLLSLPPFGIKFTDKQAVNQALLLSGKPIDEMNILRKHLSQIKGGRLAACAYPAKTHALLISDVPGDDPAVIASGPTIGDTSTLQDAQRIFADLTGDFSPEISRALIDPMNETPKPDDARLALSVAHIIAAPALSLNAGAEFARKAGVTPVLLGDDLEGEARELGCEMAVRAKAEIGGQSPIVLISGGETTVTLKPDNQGRGGRNVEFLMGFAQELGDAEGIFALACDTDGVDGVEEIAGALVTPHTRKRAADLGYPLEQALAAHDGHGFFERLKDQVITGPTLTNVNDFRAILVGRLSPAR